MNKRIIIIIIVLLSGTRIFGQSMPKFRQGFDFSNFYVLDSTDYMLLPVEWDNNGKVDQLKVYGNNRNQNIFFYNPITEEKRFLFEGSKQIINRFEGYLTQRRYAPDTTKKPLNKDYLYYSVVNFDYNSDNTLDAKDPVNLYQSKYDGTELSLLHPKELNLLRYEYIKKYNIILCVLERDDNNDKKYDNNDSEILYKIDLSNPENSKIVSVLKIKSEE
ncbi:MAG: hypothetical protein OEY34_01965 [Cyclobacteriaceae bacterium]|nr:hypothetical protein [Cyclobacteriaceae bacterium]